MGAFSRRQQPPPGDEADDSAHPPKRLVLPTLGRRLLAWSLESAILAASILVPLHLGGKLNQQAVAPSAQLTPTLVFAQTQLAKALGLPARSLPRQVTPLTNFLWSASLGLPLILAMAHLYSLSRNGKSWPKQRLGVQVLTLNGHMPGWRRAVLREGLGKWGLPLAIAYGLWKLSGGFPTTLILGGLGILTLVGESLSGLGNRPRRPWHDYLAGTCVVDQHTGAIIRLSSLWSDAPDRRLSQPPPEDSLTWWEAEGGLVSRVLQPGSLPKSASGPRQGSWGTSLSVLLLLGGLLGGSGYYFFSTADSEDTSTEALYVRLVSTLTDPGISLADKQAAVLALGNLSDQRAPSFLVSLIGQSENPQWQATLQQALIAQGFDSLPALRRLNQSLKADLGNSPALPLRKTLIIQLQQVNQVLVKLMVLEAGDRPRPLNLNHLHLGRVAGPEQDFRLNLAGQDLSGTTWQGTILNQAQFSGAQFYTVGIDQHPDTYDDQTANLSGADLSDADLSGANLSLSQLGGVSLLRADLSQATLRLANLTRANLDQATLIQASLPQAQLVEARLSQAVLIDAQLPLANLEAARLPGVDAAGANFTGANLKDVSAPAATFVAVDFTNALLVAANLSDAQLQRANLRGANLQGASLVDADLRDVFLEGANLAAADLQGALLATPSRRTSQAFVTAIPEQSVQQRFAGADFSRARNLDPEQIAVICAQGGIHPACQFSTQP